MPSQKLYSKFRELLSSYASESQIASLYADLVDLYSQSHRYYHTLDHINACLKWYDEIKNELDNVLSVALAIWFHDAIYETSGKHNEQLSAEYAVRVLSQLEIPEYVVNQVYELICLTRHPSKPSSRDSAFLIDIDLSILAVKPFKFREYEQQVRQEYQHVPALLYRIARRRVLKSFLKQDRIYSTDYFYKKWESRARANIKWAIKAGT